MTITVPFIVSITLEIEEGALENRLNADDILWASVLFSEPVLVSGQPQLRLMIGDDIVMAGYQEDISVEDQLWFKYKIIPDQTDINGISIPSNSLILAGNSTIENYTGSQALLAHNAIANNELYLVDTTVETPVIISIGNSNHVISQIASDAIVVGFAEARSIIVLQSGTSILGTSITGSDGIWRYELTNDDISVIGEGSDKSITAYARDRAGNHSLESDAFTFLVDTSPPPASPTILAAGREGYIINRTEGDTIISGIASAGTKFVHIFYEQLLLGIAQVSDLSWSYTLTAANLTLFEEGLIQLSAQGEDSRGLLSNRSDPFSSLVDRRQPSAISLSIVYASGSQQQRLNEGDQFWVRADFSEAVVVDGLPRLKLQIGSSFVMADYEPLLSTKQEIYFSYTICANQTDSDGISIPANSFILGTSDQIRDLAGNEADLTTSSVLDNPYFRVDTSVDAPLITEIGGSDHIVSRTADDSFVEGSAEDGAIIFLYAGSRYLGLTDVISGRWKYELTADDLSLMGEGTAKAISGVAKDIAGNSSDPSASYSFTIDTLSPAMLAIGRIASSSIIEGLDYTSATPYMTGSYGTITWSLGELYDEDLFSIDEATGVVTMEAKYIDTPLDYDLNNSYQYTLQATDELGNSVSKSIMVSIVKSNNRPTGLLTINGIPIQGQTLIATNTLADLDGISTISYQWSSDHVPIAGATDASLILTQDHVGKAISVSASYIDGGNILETEHSIATAPIANINDSPSGAVTISGTSEQGQTLVVTNSLEDIDGIPLSGYGSITYQWTADNIPITGETGSSLLLSQQLVGKKISVRASYTDEEGSRESVTSVSTTAVGNINDEPTGAITINGAAVQRQRLSLSNTLADIDGITNNGLGSFVYQWKADGSTIIGATDTTLLLTQDLVGKAISVSASFIDGGNTAEIVTSKATSPVANVNDNVVGTVSIFGTPIQGKTLSATNIFLDIDGIIEINSHSIAYQWMADGQVISGAISSTLELTQAEIGKAISVTASFIDIGGASEVVTSAPTQPVAAAVAVAGTLSFTGLTDTGTNSSDGLTNDNNFGLVLSGSSDSNGIISTIHQLSIDGGNTWKSTTAVQSGLLSGSYKYRAVVTGSAGNSAISNIISVEIDRLPPSAPVFLLASDTGSSSSDGLTNNDSIYLSSIEAGAIWQYSTNSGISWSPPQPKTTTSFKLLEGTYGPSTLQIRQTDAAGNTSSNPAQNLTTIILDLTAPSTFASVTSVTEGAGGSLISNGGISNGTAPLVITGTLTTTLLADELVRVFDGATFLGTASVEGMSWSYTDRRPMAAGQSITYMARVADAAGNQSTPGTIYTLSQTSTAPVISVQPVSVVEGHSGTKSAAFQVSLSRTSNQVINVNYQFLSLTEGAAATAGEDFSVVEDIKTLTFAPGILTQGITFSVHGDTVDEPDEAFRLELSNPRNASFTGGSLSSISVLGKIINDDIASALTISSAGNFEGTTSDDLLIGLDGNNRINALAGNDTITGGPGADELSGATGADLFVYSSYTDSTLSALDSLTDFSSSSGDKIDLPRLPLALYNRGVITATSLRSALQQVHNNKTGSSLAQSLLADEAVVFTWGPDVRRRAVYLSIADGVTSNFNGDLLIKLPIGAANLGLDAFT